MKTSISILSTKQLDLAARDWALAQGWELMEKDFILTVALPLDRSQLKSLDAIGLWDLVVFTSENAVTKLPPLGNTNHWRIACIGGKTLSRVQERFQGNQIRYTADNSKDLAGQIAESNFFGNVYFVCAEDHRKELPLHLHKHKIKVETLPVYKTIQQPQKVDQAYDTVLFFSPSGVESFFQMNQTKEGTVYAAIGETTASALIQYSKHVIVSETPTQEALLRRVKTYYENNSKNERIKE
jgi:uroporphyrinogen-III synthase